MTSIMLTGLRELDGKEYWLQIVADGEQSPDILTATNSDEKDPKFDFLDTQDVEVVEYESHTNEPLVDFLLRTKFSIKKAYGPNTHILCYLGGGAVHPPINISSLENQMSKINSKSPIIFLGAITPNSTTYKMVQLNPIVRELNEFSLVQVLPNHTGTDVLNVRRGTRRPRERVPGENHYPFEKLGIKPDTFGIYSCPVLH